jgi:hypothetical protein
MSEDESQFQPEQPEIEPIEEAIEPQPDVPLEQEIEMPSLEEMGVEATEELPPIEPPPPSRMSLFLRRALRWVTGLLFVFVLGILAMWAVQVRPAGERIRSLEAQLESSRSKIGELEAQVEALRPLEAENATLVSDLNRAEQRMDVLSVLVDVTSAQLAMAQDDPVAAKSALAGTDDRLLRLDTDLVGADTVRGLRTRLALVISELDTDVFAAEQDLQVLANNLVSLERSIFGE